MCVCLVSASDTMDGTWERYANNQRRAGGHDVLVGVSRIDDHRTDVSIKTFGDPLLPGATWFAVTLQRMFVGKSQVVSLGPGTLGARLRFSNEVLRPLDKAIIQVFSGVVEKWRHQLRLLCRYSEIKKVLQAMGEEFGDDGWPMGVPIHRELS